MTRVEGVCICIDACVDLLRTCCDLCIVRIVISCTRTWRYDPGFWFMHCHMESHNENGMALVIQEGNVTDMNRLPVGFKTCGSFDWSEEEFLTLSQKPSGRQ